MARKVGVIKVTSEIAMTVNNCQMSATSAKTLNIQNSLDCCQSARDGDSITGFAKVMKVFGWIVVSGLLSIIVILNATTLMTLGNSKESSFSQGQLSHCQLMPICKYQPVQVWLGHPKQYAQLSAYFDVEYSRIKWHVYGLWDSSAFHLLENQLAPYGVKLQGRGCVIGGSQFEHDMDYNEAVWNRIPEGAQQLINGRFHEDIYIPLS
jgi:hypothetical protein